MGKSWAPALSALSLEMASQFGKDWDTGWTIQGGIKSDLAMISSGKIDWPQLVADGERLGIGIEKEEDIFREEFGRRNL